MANNMYDHPRIRREPANIKIEPAPAGIEDPSGPLPTCSKTSITSADPVNPDETTIHTADYRGNFHKGLQHDRFGLVDTKDYEALVDVLKENNNTAAYEDIPLDRGRVLTNPQAGKATDTEGPNPATLEMLPNPTCDSREAAVEAIELYWMALLRDVPFSQYPKNVLASMAATELTDLVDDFHGPTMSGKVTAGTLFRGCSPGDTRGPYLSQFLLHDIPYGSLTISQQQRTAAAGVDYLTEFSAWRDAQNGEKIEPHARYDATPRYIRNVRDLAEYVHVDALYEAYLNACLMLLGAGAPLNPGNPYRNSRTQMGFGTWGGPHILSLVTEVATRALKAVWYQKWYQHRRLRPEAYGGLIEVTLRSEDGKELLEADNPALGSRAVELTQLTFGSRLLPQAFPEGSPTHPSYGAGHATVAGACVTVLKAFFDEAAYITNPVEASPDGLELVPYNGDRLTVGGELNKVAANISIGRNGGGVHWRSDYTESLKLGEAVAIHILRRQSTDYHENFAMQFTGFDGREIVIAKELAATA